MKHFYQFLIRYKIIHIVYWIYSVSTLYHELTRNRGAENVFNVYDVAINVLCQMLSVYFIVYVLLPRFFYKQQYFRFSLFSLLTIFSATALKVLVSYTYVTCMSYVSPNGSIFINFVAHSIDITGVSVLFLVVFLIEYYLQKEQKNKQLEKERLEAELNFLKAQMNPHFLFNALNSIYFLIDGNKELSKEILIRFSALLRYQLYDCAAERSPLKKEIDFLSDYIELEKIRNSEHIIIKFMQPEMEANCYIAPLLLIPFVENAFKYVSHKRGMHNYINIHCGINHENWLLFKVQNSYLPKDRTNEAQGLGIANVRRRLELLYPGKHQLQIDDVGGVFAVNLKLLLE